MAKKQVAMNPKPSESTWQLCFVLMRLHYFPVGTKLPFTALALAMFMGVQSISTRSLDLLWTKAGLWWLFIFVRHCASCVWNDICDRDIDRLVERTKTRPLASGKISLLGASSLMSILLLFTLWLLKVASGDTDLFLAGCAALATIDAPYPLMKRWISIPQFFVGATIAWPIPIAWMSVTDGKYDVVTLAMLCIAFGGSTFILDTVYACQDRSDDIQAGVKSATIAFGAHLRGTLFALATAVVTSLAVAGVTTGQGYLYFTVVVGGVALALGMPLYTLDFNNKEQCGKALTAYSNRINIVIWVGAVGDYMLRSRF
ncbi:UbiA prenyltransferase family-domain-containing protein [Irpex rosettiformis]|uniref:UbiA prenyltransferase family-domain-containing protein n=1 Tax=Irpex rosettiformis TaxID=378272 RepID=A0ACB8U0V1_9APHY|nr:UbiA prenyltransferase family-domain-containing protein [Irpex rosettiformis]